MTGTRMGEPAEVLCPIGQMLIPIFGKSWNYVRREMYL